LGVDVWGVGCRETISGLRAQQSASIAGVSWGEYGTSKTVTAGIMALAFWLKHDTPFRVVPSSLGRGYHFGVEGDGVVWEQ